MWAIIHINALLKARLTRARQAGRQLVRIDSLTANSDRILGPINNNSFKNNNPFANIFEEDHWNTCDSRCTQGLALQGGELQIGLGLPKIIRTPPTGGKHLDLLVD